MPYKNFPPIKRKKRVLRKRPRMPRRVASAPAHGNNPLHAYRRAFAEWALAAGYSPRTSASRDVALIRFIAWCDERGVTQPMAFTRALIERYQRHLYVHRKADGAALSLKTQEALLNPLRAFCRWLVRDNHLLYNPASELVVPRSPRQLPKVLLSVAQVETVLNQPDVTEASGLRDRALLETLYSSGIRRMELTNLKLYDVDFACGTLMVRQGKGRRDRLIPLGARACAWAARYVAEVRPLLTTRNDETALFLTDYGEPFEKNRLSDLVRRYMRHAGIAHGSCHAFRHACATHMLDNGADTRFIQALLGHSELSTTQIYTQVSIGKLKEIHAATHPARLERVGKAHNDGDEANPQPEVHEARSALLAALVAEDESDA